ncbi:3-oxoacyl-ACP synthase III [Gimesia fumaroli]|uniref:3-oxoacyl-[acyl-carrier-protein] synthase 3 n=1 Tax=Gimesia fumaroli TaxID=2527976 RepID=A0A518I4R3_9PLAN|nr:3-oxoacyl-ACP synthase III [Gimesia fumaroli]QDV48028.1 3-oxoacyl-[acyl-carrier-protein] synthase 3 [Gimesia fumaroli]
MRYEHVCVEAVSCTLPPHIVTSDEIEAQLEPVYERLGLPAGRLELMTGIQERRFFDRGTLPGTISAQTVNQLIDQAGFDRKYVGALFHGSVCRDQLEPATASGVHHAVGLSQNALVLDISNACLGLLNGMVFLANMIEMGQIRAGVVVGTEVGRDLVEGTIEDLLHDDTLTRKSIKNDFASLTIGSGSAAILLCDRRLSRTGHRLLGGSFQTDTSSHELCAGGVEAQKHGDHRPRMQTDSESLLVAGVNLAIPTWEQTKHTLSWQNEDVNRVFTHQVGKAHRKLLLEKLGLDPSLDYPTVETLGNTGAAALPMAWALGIQNQALNEEDRVALLGIGSGLNSLMLGVQW